MSVESRKGKAPQKSNGSVHATLRDVAKVAGVSIKTVSRVVNHQGEIKETTRQRVQTAIDHLGYRPNVLARSLIHQHSNTLAVVAWGIDYYGPSRTVVGIEKQANELGYSLFLNLVNNPDDGVYEGILDTLIARRVDGIIWAIPEVGNNRNWIKPSHLEQLIPIVFLSMESHAGLCVVKVDNRYGAILATRHLVEQGRKKIGIITGPLAWWEARERLIGWQEALQQAGLDPTPSLVFTSDDWSAVNGEQGMRALLSQEPDLDAVFACNDQIALGALGAVHAMGRSVPKNIAVVGFDNTPESAFFWPPLTTVYQQLIDVGCVAVKHLHQMILDRRVHGGPDEVLTTVIKPELIVRASSLNS